MQPGIFNKTFVRPCLAENLDAVVAHGFKHIQFNFATASLPSMPSALAADQCTSIREQFVARQITPALLSATFNIIHPDVKKREDGFRSFAVIAGAAEQLGTNVLSVSTGTCDSEDLWRAHPDNESATAWREMLAGMMRLAEIAEEHDIIVAFEPEQANVISSAAKARLLIDTLQSKRVKVLIDAANLLDLSTISQQDHILKSAFDLLGTDIIIAHAKDYSPDGHPGGIALGRGLVNFSLYLELLTKIGYQSPFIMHGFPEQAVSESLHYLTQLSTHAQPCSGC